jgi:hypothetical protein
MTKQRLREKPVRQRNKILATFYTFFSEIQRTLVDKVMSHSGILFVKKKIYISGCGDSMLLP